MYMKICAAIMALLKTRNKRILMAPSVCVHKNYVLYVKILLYVITLSNIWN